MKSKRVIKFEKQVLYLIEKANIPMKIGANFNLFNERILLTSHGEVLLSVHDDWIHMRWLGEIPSRVSGQINRISGKWNIHSGSERVADRCEDCLRALAVRLEWLGFPDLVPA